jgi:hypothetical protein
MKGCDHVYQKQSFLDIVNRLDYPFEEISSRQTLWEYYLLTVVHNYLYPETFFV